MSEMEKSTPGVPLITKTAMMLDQEPNIRAGMNYVSRMDRMRKELKDKDNQISEEKQEETPIVTAKDIEDDIYR